jgi:hypothetical protein
VDVLDDRALNRATLGRQHLLERAALDPLDAVAHLVGVQAQIPLDPYLALWSRLEPFDPHAVGALIEQRALVRIVVMRGTIHLVTADDALVLRPLMQRVLDAEIARHSEFAPELVDVDVAPVLDVARVLLSERPMTGPQLRAALAQRFPTLHAPALAYACRCLMALVQVPPRGVWGKRKSVTLTPLESWVGRPLAADPSIDDVVLRYLRAFGPASVADIASWSRLTRMREVVDRLRPQLRSFTDQRGKELLDLPEAPRPDPDTPAPVRFLPEYDNVLLSHADRRRFSSDDGRPLAGVFKGSVLVDGRVRAIWHPEADERAGSVRLVVEHGALSKREQRDVAAEAERVMKFLNPAMSAREVRLVAVP